MSERLRRINLPKYDKGEEIFNMTSHIAGGALGITATVLCTVFSALHHNVYGVVSGAVYGAMMIILYSMSSIYHGLYRKLAAKRLFRIFDHCAIFLLIAGTYTPLTLVSIRENSTALGWVYFGVVWGLAALGIVLNSIDLVRFKKVSMALYIGLGWCIILSFGTVSQALGTVGTVLLICGGVIYTIGAVIYALAKKRKYSHSIFHIFVVIGSLLHFLCILLYVM